MMLLMPVDEAWDFSLLYITAYARHRRCAAIVPWVFARTIPVVGQLGRPAQRGSLECRLTMIAIEDGRWKDAEFGRALRRSDAWPGCRCGICDQGSVILHG